MLKNKSFKLKVISKIDIWKIMTLIEIFIPLIENNYLDFIQKSFARGWKAINITEKCFVFCLKKSWKIIEKNRKYLIKYTIKK